MKALALLFVFVPLAAIAHFFHWNPGLIFLFSLLGIIPLAQVMGKSTEEIAIRAGAGIGGLLNATFGNATELIIAFFALKAGLFKVVQASITGSIIGNILFVLGLSILLGGIKHPHLRFNRTVAGLNTSLLVLAVLSLLVPAGLAATSPRPIDGIMPAFSVLVAVLLILVYAASLLFSFKTHSHLYVGEVLPEEKPTMGLPVTLGLLFGSTLLVAVMSELLVGSIEHVIQTFGLSEMFIGVVLVPIVGNAAEHLTSVTVALKNKMDLSLGIALGSATQIALFVAPVLVLVGACMGRPLTLHFDHFEVLAVMAAVLIANFITLDGESNWLEGLLLVVTYFILAVAFFFHP